MNHNEKGIAPLIIILAVMGILAAGGAGVWFLESKIQKAPKHTDVSKVDEDLQNKQNIVKEGWASDENMGVVSEDVVQKLEDKKELPPPAVTTLVSGVKIGPNEAAWSSNGEAVAYTVYSSSGKTLYLNDEIVDSLAGGSFAPFFSSDGKFGYMKILPGSQQTIFVNGQQRETYTHELVEVPIVLSPGGGQYIYVIQLQVGRKERMIVVNGDKSGLFDRFGVPIFSPDGRRYAYSAVTTVENGFVHKVFVDGKSMGAYHQVVQSDPVFSPDSAHVAFVGWSNKIVSVDVDGKAKETPYEWVGAISFTPDNKTVYTGVREGKKYLVIDGKEVMGGVGYQFSVPVFSADGLRMACRVLNNTNGKAFILVDGKEDGTHAAVSEPAVSKDGKHIAYAAQSGGTAKLIIDGEEKETSYETIDSLVYAPDNTMLIYKGKSGWGWQVVIGGQKNKKYNEIYAMQLSPDGKSVVYSAKDGDAIVSVRQSLE